MKFRSSVYATLLSPLYNYQEMQDSGGLFVEIVLLIYIFCGFAVMCDKYLIPSVEKMRERLAGSTILALASTIGLFASNMNAILLDRVDQIEIALTALLGAAVFQTTVAIAIGCFLLKKNYKMAFTILVRDLIIYLFVLVLLYYYIEMKHITISKSIILFTLWILYMIYLILSANEEEEDSVMVQLVAEPNDSFHSSNQSSLFNSKVNKSESNSQQSQSFKNVSESEGSGVSQLVNSSVHSKLIQGEEENSKLLHHNHYNHHLSKLHFKKRKFIEHLEQPISIPYFIIKGLLKIMSKPWELLLGILTPKTYDGYYLFIHFLVPSILIWNVSEIELFILEKMMKRLNVSPNFLGLTITAWGNNAPDMFSVASAFSKGMVDMAINITIASEIHNVLLGLSVPWLVYNISMKKPLTLTSNSLYAFTLFFYSFFILIFLILLKMNKLKFDSKFAIFLLTTYFVFLMLIFIITFYQV